MLFKSDTDLMVGWGGEEGGSTQKRNGKTHGIINSFPRFQSSPEPVWLLRSLSKGRKWGNWGPGRHVPDLGRTTSLCDRAGTGICIRSNLQGSFKGNSIKTSTYPVTPLARLSSFSGSPAGSCAKIQMIIKSHCRSKERWLAFLFALSPPSGS